MLGREGALLTPLVGEREWGWLGLRSLHGS
jgi:hypothetical protein